MMNSGLRICLLFAIPALAGCGDDSAEADGGSPDAAPRLDAPSIDAPSIDAPLDAPSADASADAQPNGWALGNVQVVTADTRPGGLTSLATDPSFLYFNIYAGPLKKVSHTNTIVLTVMPRDPSFDDRYEMKIEGDFVYWANHISGGGDPGTINKTSLIAQQNVWTATGLNGPKLLSYGGGYIFSIDSSLAANALIERISLDGTGRQIVFDAGAGDAILALTADVTNGDVFFARWRAQDTLFVLRANSTTPVSLAQLGANIDYLLFYENQLYVGATPSLYRVDPTDGSITLLAASFASPITSMLIDSDGIFWVAGGSAMYGCYLDGTHPVEVATPVVQYFTKQGTLAYWDDYQTIYRRTIVHQ